MRKLDERGQGMTEYIILVALIAIAAIAAVKYFGGKTRDSFQAAGDSVSTNVTDKIKNPDLPSSGQ
jgi:pilus assembly protein Flp/PilA